MNTKHLIVACACIAIASCFASEEDRKATLQSAERVNFAIARGKVMRDLRSPSDSGRNIYFPPIHLSQRTAQDAGARQVWAPFGISKPDTVAPKIPR
jgi:hypothetical protein